MDQELEFVDNFLDFMSPARIASRCSARTHSKSGSSRRSERPATRQIPGEFANQVIGVPGKLARRLPPEDPAATDEGAARGLPDPAATG